MGIGVSVFLLAVGAVLTFAVQGDLNGLDLDVVGVILMLAGAVGLALFFLVFGRRDRVVPVDRAAVVSEERVVRERRY